jgi:anti-sigma-K factor RskA
MLDVYESDRHVRQSLALFVMGALREDMCEEVDAHIDRCDVCRIELRELHEMTFALALVSASDLEELAAAPSDAQPVHVAAAAEPRSRPEPAVGRPVRRRLGVRALLAAHTRSVALAAVFALVIGFTAGLFLRASGTPVATAAAYADNQATGVSLSVSATGRDGKVSIHASVDGLRPGETYNMFVVTADGVAYFVRQWSSPDGSQVIDQEVGVPVDSLAYFTVAEAAGRVVMLAWCQPGPASTG